MSGNINHQSRNRRVSPNRKTPENRYVEAASMRDDAATRFMRDADPKKAPKVAPTMTLGALIEQNADLEARVAVLIRERDEARELLRKVVDWHAVETIPLRELELQSIRDLLKAAKP